MSLEDNVLQRSLNGVTPIADGAALVIDARGCPVITFIPGTGCTLTWSRVDQPTATAHTTGTENSDTVAANTCESMTVDWPYYRVSATGGAARVWVG